LKVKGGKIPGDNNWLLFKAKGNAGAIRELPLHVQRS
jgi:hypothetical protein